ncbi:MAG TPA: hypothetical protein VF491_24135 [Vicinamibacterales bacterium]
MLRKLIRQTTDDPFGLVKEIGLRLPDVEASIRYDGSPVLKVNGVFMAGIATDESAEADSLVVRCDLDDRELLLEDAPEIYYVTDFYERHSVVLARLSMLDQDALRDLLSVSRSLAMERTGKRRR